MTDAEAPRHEGPPDTVDEGLVALLHILTERMAVGVDPAEIERAVRGAAGAAPWTHRLEEAAAAVGVRIRWLVAPPADAVRLARPDLPVVGRSEADVWWLLDGQAFGRVHALPVADPRGPQWMSARGLTERIGGAATRTWALPEPALPAAPLASGGEGDRSPLRRLRALLWAERRDLGVVVMYGVVAGLLSLATPLAIQVLINWLAFGALLQPIVLLGIALLVCLALAAAMQILQRVSVEAIERRVFVRIVADLTTRLSRVRAGAMDGLSGPELANRFFDVLTLQKAAGTLLLDGITAVLQVVVAVTLLALYHPWLLVFDLFLLAGMALSVVPLGRGAQRTAIHESKAKYAVAAWIEEVARHPTVLRQDGSRLAESRADDLARVWLGKRRDHFAVFLRQFAGAQALQVLMSVVLLVTSGALVLRGQLTIGQFVAAEFIVTAALLGFVKFADKLDTVYDLMAGVDKLGTLLDLPPETPHGRSAPAGPMSVSLQGASLRYGDGDGGIAPVTLSLPPGSRTIVYGDPGSGKSTLAALVAGLRPPTSGVVCRGGVDLQQLRPQARYEGVVRIRTADLLAGTVRDNVTIGRPHASDPRVWAALDAVGLRARIERLEAGLDTWIDPGAGPLSDPERRALLVARAVAAEPSLVVVDGVLDGLRTEEGRRLADALSPRGAGWTLLLFTSDPRLAAAASQQPGDRLMNLGPEGLHERRPPARR
jgi:putative ABC transport system ATP-binding protein